jgi:hypothetical protein
VVRLKRLNVTEKMLLAPKAERWERQVLLRDSSAQVLLALLNNPRMEDRELLELLKSVHVTSGLLQRVAKDRRWSTNYEVQVAIVRNPKTPTPLIMRLIDGLRTKDLQVLAKSSHVRESVRKAALKVYEKRK